MQVEQLLERVRSRIVTMQRTAEDYDTEAKSLSARALDLRLGIVDLKQFITMAIELAEEPAADETPATAPGSEVAASDAAATSAGEASSPEASPVPNSPEGASEEGGGFPVAAAPHESGATGGDEGDQTSQPANVGGTPDATAGESATQEPPAVLPADAPSSEVATREDASPAAPEPTTRQRVAALHAAHPEYTRRQAWEELGISEGSLAGHGHALGIKWAAVQPVVQAKAPSPPPDDAVAPEETVTDVVQMRPKPVAKGAKFRLRAGRGEGKYLHMSGVGMTDKKSYAWIGTEAQLVGVRAKFPDALDLYEEVVEKDEVRA